MGFELRDGQWWAEDVPLQAIADEHGTPAYVYSRAAIESAWRAFDAAFAGHDHLVCYAVKANGNLAVLNLLARLGSGFDIVSGGELERVLAAGGDPAKVVFSGVGKSEAEMRRALEAGILAFNVESAAELQRLDRVARAADRQAPVSIRVNPDVDPQTHPYISTGLKENKFGVGIDEAAALYREAATMPGIRITGADCHIGSQLTSVTPVADALDRLLVLVDSLAADGIELEHLDLGGGVGIRYRDEAPPAPDDYAAALLERLADRTQRLLIEPGRAIVGNAGVMLTRVEYLKHNGGRDFAVVDAGMNDLLRPALYQAWQAIEAVQPRSDRPAAAYDIVGPVCESADTLGGERELALAAGDVLAVHSAGAYGFVMASNYNARPRPPELLVDGGRVTVVRERERYADLWHGEHLPGPD
ncbi:Diaminopimelate decarboxylase [wastewater metagenome]|uniref:diaminopimelate decarboxylase n=2 Tax=unclassified sequences TaxID=12908 RepID=A0A5B8RFC3_9ZZZZ|nr:MULTISPECIES: diaminopimelate decarboxylase [Arhodomonas]MCS4505367.1 diaminopimelate decarboxylase [Arhodomonas aquaeolei]QEA06548.1 diaminopimelate decarboxylase [uncultured organism]